MAKPNERGITPQSEDFSAWYNELVVRAELADHGPVRGTMVIRPYGYRIWELLSAELDRHIKATGHENAYFPLLIPESHLRREAEHVEGFAPELAIVTHAGGEDLEEPLVLRPTSETVVGEMFARWIGSYRDLPLRINQWANVVRWELRPRLFLRTTEFLWQEGHTAHASEDEAIAEMLVAADFYQAVAEDCAAMPVLVGDKTPAERFAGAVRTISLEAMMRDGRALQAATSHYLGTNFAAAFGIDYTGADGVRALCHTASWGMSTRMVGGVIMTHGDDRGLILPPKIAPHQVVVVPIGRDDDLGPVTASAEALARELTDRGVRVYVDTRQQVSPGFKFNDWELRGVPVRVELGPRDLATGSAVVVDRLSGAKIPQLLAEVATTMPARLAAFQEALFRRARDFRDAHTVVVNSFDDLAPAVAFGFAQTLLCGDPACEAAIQERTGATPRCVPRDADPEAGPCVVCGRPADYGRRLVFGRSY
ncbi:MAG TPA: proline--tRNA ligase [Acidimicrobiales bacterium]|nr:proline--tRNA ligase [Acidimicrobiales bacterium]